MGPTLNKLPAIRLSVRLLIPLVFSPMLAWGVGCQQKPPQADKSTGPPAIPVSHPLRRSVVDFVDFTGSTYSIDPINVRPLVTGQLVDPQTQFKEGSAVEKGDLLFQIDPRLYQAAYDQSKAQVASAIAKESIAKITYDRDFSLRGTNAVSEQQIQQDKANWDAAKAAVSGSQAALKLAETNLGYTHVTAFNSGQISRIYYTPGNIVNANSTILTTIMAMDPMYVFFNVDQRTFNRYNQVMKAADKSHTGLVNPQLPGLIGGGLVQLGLTPLNPFQMATENEVGFPWTGSINFVDNQVSASTGTVAVRGEFRNVRTTKAGNWRFIPNMFVRVRLPMGAAKPSLLVIDRAIGSDQGQKFVYVVDDEHKVQYRKVITGALQDDGLRVIEDWNEKDKTGLKESDWVVVGGLPQLRPRTVVDPVQGLMPSMANNEQPSNGRNGPQPPANKSSNGKKR